MTFHNRLYQFLLEESYRTRGVNGLWLETILEGLLDSARLAEGRLQLDRQSVDLVWFTYEALSRLTFALDVGQIEVSASVPVIACAQSSRSEGIPSNVLQSAPGSVGNGGVL